MATRSETHESAKHLDELIGFGRYQIALLALAQCMYTIQMVNLGFMGFGGAAPRMKCTATGAPVDNANCSTGCPDGNITLEALEFHSIVVHWSLVCDKASYVYLITSVQMLGILLGALCFGQLSDTYGRRVTCFSSFTGMISIGALSGLSTAWMVFCAFRFVIGFFTGGHLTTLYVYFIEFCSARHRMWLNCFTVWFGPSFLAMVGAAYAAQRWDSLSIYANLAGFFCLPAVLLCQESPHWLITHGHPDEARHVLRTIAKWNGRLADTDRTLTDHAALLQKEEESKPEVNLDQQSGWKALRYDRPAAVRIGVLSFSWFVVSLISFAIYFSVERLSGNLYLNMLYYALVRLSICALVYFIDLYVPVFGRRMLHSTSTAAILAASLLLSLCNLIDSVPHALVTVLTYVIIAGCCPLWIASYLQAVELVPTNIRNVSNSFCSVWARVGAIAAPQVAFWFKSQSYAPFLLFAAISAVDIFLSLRYLPESKNLALSDAPHTELTLVPHNIELMEESGERTDAGRTDCMDA